MLEYRRHSHRMCNLDMYTLTYIPVIVIRPCRAYIRYLRYGYLFMNYVPRPSEKGFNSQAAAVHHGTFSQ